MAEHQGQTPLLEGPYTCSNGRRNEQPSKARTIKTIIGYAICGAVLGLVGAERWGLEEVLESAKLMGVVFGVAGGLMGCIAGMNVQQDKWRPALGILIAVGGVVIGALWGALAGGLVGGIEALLVWSTGGWTGSLTSGLVGAGA